MIITKNEKGETVIRTTVGLNLTEVEMEKLKAISVKQERPLSWLVSKSVSNYLESVDITKM